jgi:hypothetical protein
MCNRPHDLRHDLEPENSAQHEFLSMNTNAVIESHQFRVRRCTRTVKEGVFASRTAAKQSRGALSDARKRTLRDCFGTVCLAMTDGVIASRRQGRRGDLVAVQRC